MTSFITSQLIGELEDWGFYDSEALAALSHQCDWGPHRSRLAYFKGQVSSNEYADWQSILQENSFAIMDYLIHVIGALSSSTSNSSDENALIEDVLWCLINLSALYPYLWVDYLELTDQIRLILKVIHFIIDTSISDMVTVASVKDVSDTTTSIEKVICEEEELSETKGPVINDKTLYFLILFSIFSKENTVLKAHIKSAQSIIIEDKEIASQNRSLMSAYLLDKEWDTEDNTNEEYVYNLLRYICAVLLVHSHSLDENVYLLSIKIIATINQQFPSAAPRSEESTEVRYTLSTAYKSHLHLLRGNCSPSSLLSLFLSLSLSLSLSRFFQYK